MADDVVGVVGVGVETVVDTAGVGRADMLYGEVTNLHGSNTLAFSLENSWNEITWNLTPVPELLEILPGQTKQFSISINGYRYLRIRATADGADTGYRVCAEMGYLA